jgi:hypothetical protein
VSDGLALFVTKADGSKQLFDKGKVANTALRLGANPALAQELAQQVEGKLYEGITTQRILQIIFALMGKYKPAVRHLFDLKRGISLMKPKPEFEVFIRVLLSQSGFQVKPNAILRGLCSEHEADAVASKDGLTYFVEVKHHANYHALTGLDESRIARAIMEDVTDGYEQGMTEAKIDRAMIVTNTRYSEHASKYGRCRGIMQIGWAFSEGFGLRDLVEKYKLYPLSCLRGVSVEVRLRLVDVGIVLIKQLREQDIGYVERKTGLSHEATLVLMEKVRATTETLW